MTALSERLEAEIRPLLGRNKYDGGYDCCGCSTYHLILDHAIRIVKESEVGAMTYKFEPDDSQPRTPLYVMAVPKTMVPSDASGRIAWRWDEDKGVWLGEATG